MNCTLTEELRILNHVKERLDSIAGTVKRKLARLNEQRRRVLAKLELQHQEDEAGAFVPSDSLDQELQVPTHNGMISPGSLVDPLAHALEIDAMPGIGEHCTEVIPEPDTTDPVAYFDDVQEQLARLDLVQQQHLIDQLAGMQRQADGAEEA